MSNSMVRVFRPKPSLWTCRTKGIKSLLTHHIDTAPHVQQSLLPRLLCQRRSSHQGKRDQKLGYQNKIDIHTIQLLDISSSKF